MPPPSSLISFQYVVQNMDDDLNNNIDLTWLESSRYPNQNRFKYPELQTEIPALQNDSGFQSRLRAELAMLKRKSALKVNPNQPMWHVDPNRSCGRCRAELGRIMNRGAFCQVCKVRVCKNCREYNIKGTDWICTVCHKNLEIQVASGEWVKEHMSHSGLIPIKKKNSRHYIPTAPVDLIKSNKNIKRSWTISNPSGTAGPQIQPRSQVDPRNPFHEDPRLPPPKIAPPLFLNIPPPPTTSPPPIPTGGHTRFMPNLHPPGVVTRRNVPLRSQSMSQADHQSRYHGPVPRRHHPLDRVELADIDSDIMEPRKYKTLEGPLRSGARAGQPAIITHPENGGFSTNSLERGMRRRLPDVPPSRSLPRPAKRGQSDSRSRERTGNQKRSQSYGDDLQDSKRNPRQLPGVPGSNGQESHFERHIIREPTPDYDASSIMDEPATTKVKANAIRDQERSQEVYFGDQESTGSSGNSPYTLSPSSSHKLLDYSLDLAYSVIDERPEDEAMAATEADQAQAKSPRHEINLETDPRLEEDYTDISSMEIFDQLPKGISPAVPNEQSKPVIICQTWYERQGVTDLGGAETPPFSRGSSIRSGIRSKRGSRRNSALSDNDISQTSTSDDKSTTSTISSVTWP